MLKRLNNNKSYVEIKDASFPSPFISGLEYSAPARGCWNIVHTGMLIPEAHQIFVCAAGCLRGVVLTAAEMNATERFSTIEIKEKNVLDGDMESLILDGVEEIINNLPYTPKAILLYTSCIHHFMASDTNYVFSVLKDKYPDIMFTDCYMNPIMRKSGLNPDQTMRKQLYSLLKPSELNKKQINILGNDIPTDSDAEFVTMFKNGGYEIKDITVCNSFDDYQSMAGSFLNIVYYPSALPAAKALKERLGQEYIYLPQSFDFDTNERYIKTLYNLFQLPQPDIDELRTKCSDRLNKLSETLSGTEVYIDYTAFPRPFELAKLLVKYGIFVTRIYADSISEEEKDAFFALKNSNIKIYPTVNACMRVENRHNIKKAVAIGQKAAYFNSSSHFVNIVEGGGLWGFSGIIKLCDEIENAFNYEKDTRKLIQIKGLGCGCC